MDNVTHTLIGALLGETAARSAQPAPSDRHARARRGAFLALMIVGSNLPDSDVLYSAWSDSKLDYLLEHRGHTHTVVGAIVMSVVLLAVCELWLRWRRIVMPARDRAWLIGLALLAPLLHIAMDAFNTYGVHPWWPLDNRWYYGDSVFIVEPLFWAATAPLAFLFRTYAARGFVVLALLAGLYLAWSSGLVAPASIVGFCVLALVMLACGRYAPPRTALVTGIAICLALTATFVAAGREAQARVDAYAATRLPRSTTIDRVRTPLPMNPFCWEVILVQTEGEDYALRRGVASLLPPAMPSLRCPAAGAARATTAPLRIVALPATPFLQWHGEIVLRREQLQQLAAGSCEVAAFMRFARAPWFAERTGTSLIGDLRYDREPELSFAELDLDRPARCPAYVPPWVPPRSDLLRRDDGRG